MTTYESAEYTCTGGAKAPTHTEMADAAGKVDALLVAMGLTKTSSYDWASHTTGTNLVYYGSTFQFNLNSVGEMYLKMLWATNSSGFDMYIKIQVSKDATFIVYKEYSTSLRWYGNSTDSAFGCVYDEGFVLHINSAYNNAGLTFCVETEGNAYFFTGYYTISNGGSTVGLAGSTAFSGTDQTWYWSLTHYIYPTVLNGDVVGNGVMLVVPARVANRATIHTFKGVVGMPATLISAAEQFTVYDGATPHTFRAPPKGLHYNVYGPTLIFRYD